MTDTLPTVADMMAAYAEDAVDHAKSAGGVTLDYSPASVEAVEAVLTKLHEALPKGFLARLFGRGPSPAEVATVSKMYGGYVGEVLRRARGGEWKAISGADLEHRVVLDLAWGTGDGTPVAAMKDLYVATGGGGVWGLRISSQ